eukprot:GHVS01072118.1.p2 GENE.GHVS01072118.1~~GHVS01072118.1.p2  ORF type:complete len:115 (+),score=5.74 GHVS01072118.1:35-379(+)
MESLDISRRDLHNSDIPFGRKLLVLVGGDFRQIMPLGRVPIVPPEICARHNPLLTGFGHPTNSTSHDGFSAKAHTLHLHITVLSTTPVTLSIRISPSTYLHDSFYPQNTENYTT